MKCREFATQIPCQNRVLTQENIENVFPHDAFIITAVYPNIFTARLKEDGIERNYTFQYVDLLTHTMEIKELNKLNN